MMKSLIVVLCLLSLTQAWKTYRGYRTYKVIPQSEEQLKDLRTIYDDIELDVWKTSRGVGDEAHVMVSPEKQQSFAELMVSKGFTLDIHVEDVGDGVAEFKARMDARRKPDGRMDFRLNDYNTVVDTYSQLEAWQTQCPDGVTCEVVNIGQSYEGLDVNMFTMLTPGEDKQKIYIDSLTHAREFLSGSTVNNIINEMVTGYGEDADVTRVLDTYDWYFVPIMNPDGYQYALDVFNFWRKNRQPNVGGCVGTDLNRNFDTGFWGADDTSRDPCDDTYGGASAASAPETQNIQAILNELQPHILISIHAYGRMWLQPYGHTVDNDCAMSSNHQNMMDAGEAAILKIEEVGLEDWVYGTVCNVIYPAAGGTIDYAGRNGSATLYSYTPELSGGSFNPPTTEIQPTFNEIWQGILALIAETEMHQIK